MAIDQCSLYWLAGILEGEGHFSLPCKRRPNSPIIGIKMTDRDVIDKVASLFQTSTYIVRPNPKHPLWKQCYSTRLTGGRAANLMQEIYPLMGVRRQCQIDIALQGKRGARPVTRTRSLSRQEESRLVSLMAEKVSVAGAARIVGVHECTIYRYFQRNGITTPRRVKSLDGDAPQGPQKEPAL